MKWLAGMALGLMALLGVAGCANLYDDLSYPEARFSLGDQ
jgi:hypothetical protein